MAVDLGIYGEPRVKDFDNVVQVRFEMCFCDFHCARLYVSVCTSYVSMMARPLSIHPPPHLESYRTVLAHSHMLSPYTPDPEASTIRGRPLLMGCGVPHT